jgi:hypothetical protein
VSAGSMAAEHSLPGLPPRVLEAAGVRQTYAARLSHWLTVFSWPEAAAGATPPGTPSVAWVATLPVLRAIRAPGQMRPEVEGPLRRAERS